MCCSLCKSPAEVPEWLSQGRDSGGKPRQGPFLERGNKDLGAPQLGARTEDEVQESGTSGGYYGNPPSGKLTAEPVWVLYIKKKNQANDIFKKFYIVLEDGLGQTLCGIQMNF